MSIIFDEISMIIDVRPPRKVKDVAAFVRKARQQDESVLRKYPEDVKEYFALVADKLRNGHPYPVPEDFEESDEIGESDTEIEESRYFAQTKVSGYSSVVCWNVEHIIKMFERKTLIVPEFQRRSVWKKPTRQAFIDSLFNSLIRPHFIFTRDIANDKAPHNVIDGLQRITTLRMFVSNEITTSSYSQYPNTKFSDLPQIIQEQILNLEASINVTVCEPQHWTHLFRVINKGGMPLNSMEIRRAIYKSPVLESLEQLSNEHKLWEGMYGKNNRRYAGLEMMLRAVAMHYFYQLYEKPMESFLNLFCMQLKDKRLDIDADVLSRQINQLLTALFMCENKRAFKMDREKSSGNNKSLVDCIFHGGLLLIEQNGTTISNSDLNGKIVQLQKMMMADPIILTALQKTTSDKERVMQRMQGVEKCIEAINKQ